MKPKVILHSKFMRKGYIDAFSWQLRFHKHVMPNIPENRFLFLSFSDDGKGSLWNPSFCMPLRDTTSSCASISPPALDFLCWSVLGISKFVKKILNSLYSSFLVHFLI